jgi:hypothetical protein
MSQERRLHPRAIVGLRAQIQQRGTKEWDDVLLYDLSAGDGAVHAQRPVPIQSEVRLRFLLPGEPGEDERQVTITCLVVRSGSPDQSGITPTFVAGLHFLDLGGEDFNRIRVFVWSQLQLHVGEQAHS